MINLPVWWSKLRPPISLLMCYLIDLAEVMCGGPPTNLKTMHQYFLPAIRYCSTEACIYTYEIQQACGAFDDVIELTRDLHTQIHSEVT